MSPARTVVIGTGDRQRELGTEHLFVLGCADDRVRGVSLTDTQASELAQRLLDDETGITVAARLTRALENDGGVVGISKLAGRAVLLAVDSLIDGGPSERLLELRASLVQQLSD